MTSDRAVPDDLALPPRPGSRAHRRARGVHDAHATSRTTLSRERIVAAAIEVLDAEGLDAVSMRRVATELGTGPASLYAHVGDKQELLDLVLDEVLGAVEVPDPDPARWQEQLKDVARAIRQAYKPHNDVAVISLGNIPTTPNVLRLSDRLLGIMLAGGVPMQLAGWFIDQLAKYIDADSVEGAILGRRFGGDHEAGMQWFREIRQYYHDLPRERFPNIAAMQEELTGGGDDERFEFGLGLLVDGLADRTRRAT